MLCIYILSAYSFSKRTYLLDYGLLQKRNIFVGAMNAHTRQFM